MKAEATPLGFAKNGSGWAYTDAVDPRDLHSFLTDPDYERVTDSEIMEMVELLESAWASTGVDIDIYDESYNPLVEAIKVLAYRWVSPTLNGLDRSDETVTAKTEAEAWFVVIGGSFYYKRVAEIAAFLTEHGYDLGPKPRLTKAEHDAWCASVVDQKEPITPEQTQYLEFDDVIYTSGTGVDYGKVVAVKFGELATTVDGRRYRAGTGAYTFTEKAMRDAMARM